MADIITSYQVADRYGRAAFEQMDTALTAVLLAGDFPELQAAFSVLLADSLSLPQFCVVALDNAGKLVRATATGNKPIGVLAHATVSGAGNTTVRGPVWFSGCFALEGPLVWDASFNTDDLKLTAFRGAPTPTQIVVRRRLTPAS